ncbi:phosphate ABC transporter permease PstA [Virgibacillus halodenitrificans]|jgi:phosphate transport system permease protein|uniref:Phosphate transport system permease protein PstA n=1 Tax=Virgibacillus halodenitrificans TaxID=1482 RepID=A0ABR7VS14_VIRHA|nr:phosphate ABC transporter permease PstA [Virgibacillus halodenitrificans]MBD1223562.1 phosphate ABC transporter permease PstA [Virgibacillus halodenitrificans]MCJ0932078.1 phosphate ABC transporter permease PstA [Virgibacillus halodenitrificans]MYL44182.1 phosphate ABC transporter permease PstA [Virgibacillus halodenitrificans]MYL60669.1 phosphate ABC transporter permease PstA [Virgibacillus halodenitrificans]WHX28246.1 phosphate ABC transporter permease PstA [Virgibacillus halodenitrifican
MKYIDQVDVRKRMNYRILKNSLFKAIFLSAAMFGLIVLAILLVRVFSQGVNWIDMEFIASKLSTNADRAGIMGAILGTFWLMVVVIPATLIIGIGTAIYLELYAKKGRMQALVQTNIANLAGVPSIVYGLLGLTVFVRAMDLGNIVLAGGLTLSLLVLPIVIVAAQEAIRSVPQHLSEASYGMGATKWQTVKNVVLPAALPSILTGSILAFSRAIGETAPLTVIGIPALLIPFPGGIMDTFTVLPMQIYYWTLDSSLVAEYANLAAATIVVLLLMLFILNFIAVLIRNKFQKRY